MIKTWMMNLLGRTPPGGISCHQVGEILQQYLDGHIDAERASRIEEHLEACRRCGMEAETYEQIKVTLANQRSDVPAESVDRLREFGERLASGEEPTAP
ncbi:MAG: anti-sigma factor [Acidimicrobiia bacterium]|nr:anti-sigma factor [Acidimicrobiia bacterium]